MFFKTNKYLRIDHNQLKRTIDAIHHHTNASAATIQVTLIDMLDLTFYEAPSTSYIENVINNSEKVTIAQNILKQQDKLCAPKVNAICGDELCAPNITYLTCEPHSGYALSLDHFDDHQRGQKKVWTDIYHTLKDQGLNPTFALCDQAAGTLAGHKNALPHSYVFADHFHLYKNLSDAKDKASRDLEKLHREYDKATQLREKHTLTNDQLCLQYSPELLREQLQIQQEIQSMTIITQNLKTLTSWFFAYILSPAGYNIPIRSELYDFIVDELEKCALLTLKSTLSATVKSMKSQKDKLLFFLKYLDDQFHDITARQPKHIDKSLLWNINKYLQYSPNNPNAISLKAHILSMINDKQFQNIISEIKNIHQNMITSSSYAENYISRVKPSITRLKKPTQDKMDLIRFIVNNTNVHSSRDYQKRARTPAQLLLQDDQMTTWINYLHPKPHIRINGIEQHIYHKQQQYLKTAA